MPPEETAARAEEIERLLFIAGFPVDCACVIAESGMGPRALMKMLMDSLEVVQ